METTRFERLATLMARMADGDRSALFDLYEEFGDAIRAALRREFRRLGVDRVDAAEVDGLTLDACVDLCERAGSWDPARGVAPWTWAAFRLRNLVAAAVGQFADALPEGGPAEATAPTPAGDDDALVTLRRLAEARDDLRLLLAGLERVGGPGQQALLLEFKVQAGLGDPSPAVTVARMAGVRPDAVRQTCKRLLDRLRLLCADDPEFAALGDLSLLRPAA